MPSYSTHRLQPLDVSLFSSLITYYTNGLQQLIINSYNITGNHYETHAMRAIHAGHTPSERPGNAPHPTGTNIFARL
jgi:hypothetical protein